MPTRLFHATSRTRLEAILQSGLQPGSFWTTDEDVADYYASVIEDEGDDASLLVIDLARLERLAAAAGRELLPDLPSIDEPITTAIRMSEEEVQDAWQASAKGWRDSLEVVRSLNCPFAIPADALSVLSPRADQEVSLESHLAEMAAQARATRP